MREKTQNIMHAFNRLRVWRWRETLLKREAAWRRAPMTRWNIMALCKTKVRVGQIQLDSLIANGNTVLLGLRPLCFPIANLITGIVNASKDTCPFTYESNLRDCPRVQSMPGWLAELALFPAVMSIVRARLPPHVEAHQPLFMFHHLVIACENTHRNTCSRSDQQWAQKTRTVLHSYPNGYANPLGCRERAPYRFWGTVRSSSSSYRLHSKFQPLFALCQCTQLETASVKLVC